jgi:pimeloyl-ACP methyl ester carboxylesterase
MKLEQFQSDRVEALVTKWHEAFFPIEILLLHADPVYYGYGVPAGDGSGVILIPGFMHGDLSLLVMYAWLTRIGYRPYYSGIDLNADCPDLLIRERLASVLRKAQRETRRRVHVIGNSLGGVIARSLVAQFPSAVRSVITLGSPFRGKVLHRSILRETEIIRNFILIQHGARVFPECYTSECGCAFMKALRRGVRSRIAQTAIYTRNDGVVDWRCCVTGDPKIDVEVKGTHAGLGFNPRVYKVIAQRLAAAQQVPAPITRRTSGKVAQSTMNSFAPVAVTER